jgi:hypothetical protein
MIGRNGRSTKYFLLALVVLVLAAAGYTVYALYPRFDLPPATGIGLLALAAIAGIASLFTCTSMGRPNPSTSLSTFTPPSARWSRTRPKNCGDDGYILRERK